MEAGMRVGDTLVMIDRDPVVGMSFSQVLALPSHQECLVSSLTCEQGLLRFISVPALGGKYKSASDAVEVLNRLWATRGAQPGEGLYYRVVTENPHGIGIRVEPDVNSQRTGEDLVRGAVFQACLHVHQSYHVSPAAFIAEGPFCSKAD
eukprot:1946264-Amphidinium_carterae.3